MTFQGIRLTERLQQQLAFLMEIDNLKLVLRQTRLVNHERMENSAEHSWHLAMLAIILQEYANQPLHIGRVLQLVLVHDLVEIDAGDTFCYDSRGYQDKQVREQRAADRIFGLLPRDQAQEVRALWDEFEAGQTPEARFAAALDRLMPLLHNYHTNGGSWQVHGITHGQVLARNAHIQSGSATLWDLAQQVIEDAVAQGILASSPMP